MSLTTNLRECALVCHECRTLASVEAAICPRPYRLTSHGRFASSHGSAESQPNLRKDPRNTTFGVPSKGASMRDA